MTFTVSFHFSRGIRSVQILKLVLRGRGGTKQEPPVRKKDSVQRQRDEKVCPVTKDGKRHGCTRGRVCEAERRKSGLQRGAEPCMPLQGASWRKLCFDC